MSEYVNERYGVVSQNDDRSVLAKLLTRDDNRPGVQNENCTIAGQTDRLAEQNNKNVKLGCGDCNKCTKESKAKRVNLSLNREEQGQTNKKCKFSDETEKIKIISVVDIVNGKELGSKVTVADNVVVCLCRI